MCEKRFERNIPFNAFIRKCEKISKVGRIGMSVRLIRKRIEQRHVQLSPHKTLWMTSNEQRYLLLHSNKRRRILRRDWRHLRLTWTFRGIIPLRFISSSVFYLNSRKIQYWSATSFLSIYLKYIRYSMLFFRYTTVLLIFV